MLLYGVTRPQWVNSSVGISLIFASLTKQVQFNPETPNSELGLGHIHLT